MHFILASYRFSPDPNETVLEIGGKQSITSIQWPNSRKNLGSWSFSDPGLLPCVAARRGPDANAWS